MSLKLLTDFASLVSHWTASYLSQPRWYKQKESLSSLIMWNADLHHTTTGRPIPRNSIQEIAG